MGVDTIETMQNLNNLEDELKEMTEDFEYIRIGYDVGDGILSLTIDKETTEHTDLPDMINKIMDERVARGLDA